MLSRVFGAMLIVLSIPVGLLAQDEESGDVSYEVIYDEPFAVNQLFVHFHPLYGELFVTNVNAGFGLKADYYMKDIADFSISFRKTYGRQFYDLSRDQLLKNSDVDNKPKAFGFFEFGGTYHIKDIEQSSQTKVILFKDSERGNQWASHVPSRITIPAKVRKIYGARLGGYLWGSSVDVDQALEAQGLTNADLIDQNLNAMPEDIKPFSTLSSAGIYVGGSMAWIRNMAVTFEDYNDGVEDLILTTYFDILIAPAVKLDDIVYTERDINGNVISTSVYRADPIATKKIGFRAGVEGKFNRKLGWAYSGEFGYRPSVEGMGFFAGIKISVPVYSRNIESDAEVFGQ